MKFVSVAQLRMRAYKKAVHRFFPDMTGGSVNGRFSAAEKITRGSDRIRSRRRVRLPLQRPCAYFP